MNHLVLKLIFIGILWVPFSLGSIAAVVVSLLAILFDWQEYGKNVLRAMDKTLAAVCGFSGFYTLSAECGVSTKQPWVLLRKLLDLLQKEHCVESAKHEGLIHG